MPRPRKNLARAASLPVRRPAETGTLVAGAIVVLLGSAVDLNPAAQGAAVIVLCFIPTAITWVVELVRK